MVTAQLQASPNYSLKRTAAVGYASLQGIRGSRRLAQALGGMNYRCAKPEDAERLSELVMSFQHLLTADPDGSGAETFFASVSADAERGYIQSGRYYFLVAETGEEIVGFIAIRDRTHLFHMFVASSHQRRGLARELWRRARKAVEELGPVEQFTVNSSTTAVPVYERFGFRAASDPVREHGVEFIPMRYRPVVHAA